MQKIILLGGGGHCESVIEVIEGFCDYKISGILDSSFSIEDKKFILGYPILGNDDMIEYYSSKNYEFVITVGQIKSSTIRTQLYERVKSVEGKLPVIIASTAHVSKHSTLGEGTVIMHYAMVNSNVDIGKNNIINSFSNIEHGCQVGDFNHISTRVTLNGNVVVGDHVFIGSGTIVNEGCMIDNDAVIGSGSVVRKNIKSNTIAFGNPLKILKNG